MQFRFSSVLFAKLFFVATVKIETS